MGLQPCHHGCRPALHNDAGRVERRSREQGRALTTDSFTYERLRPHQHQHDTSHPGPHPRHDISPAGPPALCQRASRSALIPTAQRPAAPHPLWASRSPSTPSECVSRVGPPRRPAWAARGVGPPPPHRPSRLEVQTGPPATTSCHHGCVTARVLACGAETPRQPTFSPAR